ncbi:TonB-dependent receptor [bacterium]|nr:TonB-dependent receptor [bacterium]
MGNNNFSKVILSVVITLMVGFAIGFASAAEGIIKGKVVDAETGKPLPNANVKVSGTHFGAATDPEGKFMIINLEPGKYYLVISILGYETQTLKGVEINGDRETYLKIELQASPLKSDKVVVTATRHSSLLEDVPEITFVIPEREIEMVSPQDISEVITYVPGVSIEGGTGSGQPFKRNVSIDGLPSQYCMVLLNGARVVSSHYHTGANVNVIPPENIERIELVKGAASAQYGSDGMGGVLNIISKTGTENPELLYTSYGGSQNTFHTSLSLRGSINDRVKHSIFSSWEQSDGVPIIEPVFRLGQFDYTLFHLMDKIDAYITENLSLGAQMFYLASSYPYKGDSPYDSWLITPKLDLEYNMTEDLNIKPSFYYTKWNSERNSEINEIAEPELSVGFGGLKNNYLLFGGEFSYRNFRRTSVTEEDQQAFGLFLQDEWQLLDNLSLLAALRFDKVENIDGVFTPKLTAMYEPVNILKLRASVGQGFRAPSIQDLYETLYGHGTHIRAGNPDLEPEYSTGITGSVEVEPLTSLSIMLNGYYTSLADMITPIDHGLESPFDYFTPEEIPSWDPEDTTLYYIYRRENIHKAAVYGGEFKLLWNFVKNLYLEGSLNYTYNENKDTGESLPYFPGSTVSAKVYGNQSLNKWLNIGGFLGVNAVSGRKIWKYQHDGQQQVELDDYQKLDAGMNITFNDRYQVFGTVDNLLGQEIHSYEDVEMRIEGKPLYYAGIRIKAF